MTQTKGTSTGKKSRRNLVVGVADALRTQIGAGDYQPGDKLPPEAQLTVLHDVSRTVIREAIAALRADGLVEPRQGAGVFVLEPPKAEPKPFQIVEIDKLSAIIEMLELRAAVEIGAAGLAATRRSPAQEEAILDAHEQFVALAHTGEPTTEADLTFHRVIAQASNNPRFVEFLDVMGQTAIPRATLKSSFEQMPGDYLVRIGEEHRQIAEAISNSDTKAAQDAMELHLRGSQRRYRAAFQSDLRHHDQ
ncbi:FadR/GntR family transcriptional regulator [Qingshengfaniella alkalisoli]|uniref:FadR family transcriptional regulator n=1 Tax=Qingshengfaniella alkalisoli TaxID=2599296 RepID=A0A5B8IAH7_9RHOB|nr:FadR/GntR family transcriptional regulator [Qingshengfaniella alkalisoli]QDY71495.1 FadR family transcriptional regulator [Qingshengfaniella alkalisoli]